MSTLIPKSYKYNTQENGSNSFDDDCTKLERQFQEDLQLAEMQRLKSVLPESVQFANYEDEDVLIHRIDALEEAGYKDTPLYKDLVKQYNPNYYSFSNRLIDKVNGSTRILSEKIKNTKLTPTMAIICAGVIFTGFGFGMANIATQKAITKKETIEKIRDKETVQNDNVEIEIDLSGQVENEIKYMIIVNDNLSLNSQEYAAKILRTYGELEKWQQDRIKKFSITIKTGVGQNTTQNFVVVNYGNGKVDYLLRNLEIEVTKDNKIILKPN